MAHDIFPAKSREQQRFAAAIYGISNPLPRLLDRADWSIIALVVAYSGAAALALTLTDASEAIAFQSYFLIWPLAFFVIFPAIFGLLILLRIVHRLPSRRGRLMAFRRAIKPRYVRPLLSGLVLLGAMMLFQGAFTSIKTALPLWAGGFQHDVFQADIDRAIHGGVDPWRYLIGIAGNDWIRAIVEWNYNQGWFVFCYGTLFVIATSARTVSVRPHYFIAYILTWIVIGNLMAGLFLSAGPAFYGAVTGDTARFADQLAFLAASENSAHSAARLQAYLWSFYEGRSSGFGSGISAFPSMHIAMVTLNALFIARASRLWGAVAFGYVALVLASSVYLAWHYAIDGYVAVLVTVAIYYATRPLFRASAAPLPR